MSAVLEFLALLALFAVLYGWLLLGYGMGLS